MNNMLDILNNLFNTFGIKAKAINIKPGLRIDQYQVKLDIGERLDRIQSVRHEIALALKSITFPNIYPIYEKGIIAIDTSKSLLHPVYFSEVIESHQCKEDLDIPLVLGKDMWNNIIVKDLAKCPHVMIGGTTGSGKSMLIKSIVSGILNNNPSKKDVSFLFIDPKGTELEDFDKISQKCWDRLISSEDIIKGLNAASAEMENRFLKLAKARVNKIKEYKKKKDMPYLIIVIDELADIFLVDNKRRKQLENTLIKIAQKGRAVGVHLVMNTQRPSADLIPKSILANIPTRIALKTASSTDSRIILEKAGAESLAGQGEMLLSFNGDINFIRIQGTLIEKQTIQNMIRKQSKIINVLDYLRERVN